MSDFLALIETCRVARETYQRTLYMSDFATIATADKALVEYCIKAAADKKISVANHPEGGNTTLIADVPGWGTDGQG